MTRRYPQPERAQAVFEEMEISTRVYESSIRYEGTSTTEKKRSSILKGIPNEPTQNKQIKSTI